MKGSRPRCKVGSFERLLLILGDVSYRGTCSDVCASIELHARTRARLSLSIVNTALPKVSAQTKVRWTPSTSQRGVRKIVKFHQSSTDTTRSTLALVALSRPGRQVQKSYILLLAPGIYGTLKLASII